MVNNNFLSTKTVTANGDIQWVLPNGDLHREDGPAKIGVNGTEEWWVNGKKHREGGPATITTNGDQYWYLNGKRHRLDGPAFVFDNIKHWYVNDKLHRDNGPSVIHSDSSKTWLQNGKLHRISVDGTKEWWINGEQYYKNKPIKSTVDKFVQTVVKYGIKR